MTGRISALLLIALATGHCARAQETPCEDGVAAGFSCENVALLSWLPVDDVGGTRLNDLWGWEDTPSGRRFVLQGRQDGTSFIEVTDPFNPVYLGYLPATLGSRPSIWRDIKVFDGHAFIVADGAENHGMQVFNLALLLSAPVGTPTRFSELIRYEGFRTAHNLVINEETGFAYAVGSREGVCDLGLHMVDVRDPRRPEFSGCLQDRRSRRAYVHDAQCVIYRGPDVAYSGREICFMANEDTFSMADVTDKTAPQLLGMGTYPTSRYVHQGWLTADHRYFYQNDELDERMTATPTKTLVWDVSDLDDPVLIREFHPGPHSIDHNLYIHQGLALQANYTSGLRVLDVGDPEDPVAVGHFDTTPSDESVSFNGAWTAYPFFSDGTVAVSSRDEGLFLLRVTGTEATRLADLEVVPEAEAHKFLFVMRRQADVDRYELELAGYDGSYQPVATTPGGGTVAGRQQFEISIPTPEPGRSRFRLSAVSSAGERRVLALEDVYVVPGTHVLAGVFPNPTAGRATVGLVVERSQRVSVAAFDAAGREVAHLHEGRLNHESELRIAIDTTAWPPGPYWIRVVGADFVDAVSLIVAR